MMTIFVYIVYNKFDAQIKQDVLNYLRQHIPNLGRFLWIYT